MNFLKISGLGLFLFGFNAQYLFPMARFYFEKEDSLVVKLLVLVIGMALGMLVTAKAIYPQLLEEGMNPFKARNIYYVTVYSFFVLLFGITFHTTLDILFVSIALGVIMVVWMLIAILKK
jgi:hypothetical protein